MRRIALLCIAAVFSLGIAVVAGDAAPVSMKIIAQQPGSSFYSYATSLVRILDQSLPAGSVVEIIPRGGSIANPSTLNAGRADVAMALSCTAAWAYQGDTSVYPAGKHENIRGITGGMHLSYTLVMIRKEYAEKNGITSFEDVFKKKARIVMKPMGSVVIPIAAVIFSRYGVTLDSLRDAGLLTQAQPSQIGEMLRDGRADVYIENVPLNHPSVTEITLTNDLLFLPISDVANKELAGMGMSLETLPAGSYRGMNADYPTNATGMVILANKDADENAVYMLTKVIAEQKDELAKENAALKVWDPKRGCQPDMVPVPLHPGALRYYHEKNWVK